MRKRWLIGMIMMVALLALAACGDDEDDNDVSTGDTGDAATADTIEPAPDATEAAAAGPNLSAGPGLSLGGSGESTEDAAQTDTSGIAGRLPGCSDADAEECPSPVDLPLDADAAAEGVTMRYLARYFVANTDDENPEGVPIRIAQGENFPFEQQATFDVYFAESIDNALSELNDPITGAWTSAQGWEGTIGVEKDTSQDPQVNTSIGAFELPDGRVIVLKALTTGEYGWDVWSVIYERMLDSLAVETPDLAE